MKGVFLEAISSSQASPNLTHLTGIDAFRSEPRKSNFFEELGIGIGTGIFYLSIKIHTLIGGNNHKYRLLV